MINNASHYLNPLTFKCQANMHAHSGSVHFIVDWTLKHPATHLHPTNKRTFPTKHLFQLLIFPEARVNYGEHVFVKHLHQHSLHLHKNNKVINTAMYSWMVNIRSNNKKCPKASSQDLLHPNFSAMKDYDCT